MRNNLGNFSDNDTKQGFNALESNQTFLESGNDAQNNNDAEEVEEQIFAMQ